MKIALVGEAWGEHEARARQPFVGPAGRVLDYMLAEAGIHRTECHLTNVFNFRPANNDISTLCCPDNQTKMPPLQGGYLQPQYLGEIDRLRTELSALRPNVIVALGNTATWALLSDRRISKVRGVVQGSKLCPGIKVLPTYHPAAVMREWYLRPTTVLDLMKARRESLFPEIRRPERTILIDPTLSDLEDWYEQHILPASILSFDIETAGNQITCVGFSPRRDLGLVVPFVDPRKPGCSYWGSAADELQAWNHVRAYLQSPAAKIGQNALYDINYLWGRYGIRIENYVHDTMLLHHSLQPEALKSLEYLGSIYTDEGLWKSMRSKGTIKKED